MAENSGGTSLWQVSPAQARFIVVLPDGSSRDPSQIAKLAMSSTGSEFSHTVPVQGSDPSSGFLLTRIAGFSDTEFNNPPDCLSQSKFIGCDVLRPCGASPLGDAINGVLGTASTEQEDEKGRFVCIKSIAYRRQ